MVDLETKEEEYLFFQNINQEILEEDTSCSHEEEPAKLYSFEGIELGY